MRTSTARTLLATVFATLLVVGPLPTPAWATAGDPAHLDCLQGVITRVLSSVSFTVPGNSGLQQVSLPEVQTGDVLRVTATGVISTGGLSGSHGPDGNLNDPAPTSPGWPAWGLNKYSLYGVWGRDGSTFRAGSDSGCLDQRTTGTGPGTVFLGINDENLSDNTGGFNVTVRVWRNQSDLRDGGFEQQTSRTVSAPWSTEGPDFKGIDIGLNLARSGRNNAFIRTSSTNWNSFTQPISVRAFTPYRMQGFVRTSSNVWAGFFGVRVGTTTTVLKETQFGPQNGYQRLTVDFTTGPNTVLTAFVGYWAPGADSWIQLDDVAIWSV